MSFLSLKSHNFALLPLVFCAGFVGAAQNAIAAEGPFAGYAGYWSGEGTISVASGANERIRCKATYAVSANDAALNQSLRCASDSYRLDITSDVASQGGTLSGSWSEATRNATGRISGRIDGNGVNAVVAGVGFTAAFTLMTHGKTQSVTIHPEGGTDIRAVSITMHKN
jgi:hypothetical protein